MHLSDYIKFSSELEDYFRKNPDETRRFREAVGSAFQNISKEIPSGFADFRSLVSQWTRVPFRRDFPDVLVDLKKGEGDIQHAF